MKNKKELIGIIAIALIVIACIAAAVFVFIISADDEPSLQEVIENRAESYKTDFLDSIGQMENQASVTKYLVNWAENKGISVTTDQSGNVIYSYKATEGLEDRKPSVVLCGYDYSCIESYTNSIVCALTLARSEDPHGKYKIIFVSEENGNKEAANTISKSYLEDAAEVFYLGNDTSSKIADKSSGIMEYQFKKDIQKMKPSYNKAYKITISNLPTQPITDKSVSAPNPIKTLGNLLATFKSKSVLYDLVEFTGGSNNSLTPSEASITIVVSEDATEKVENRLNNAIESFNDKYNKKYPEATYTYEVVEMPQQVIESSITESLISLLYTAPNGVYAEEDDDNKTVYSSITSINIVDGTASISVVCSGYDEVKLAELTESYQTICALTDMKFEEISSYPTYSLSENSKSLANSFSNSYNEYKTNSLDIENMARYTMCSLLAKKYPDMNLIAIGVTERTKDNFAGGLVVHLGKL